MQFTIQNSQLSDISEIFRLYRVATAYQKPRFRVFWPEFERSLVEKEIEENRQWKMVTADSIASVWAITFSDPEIWEEKNKDPAIYIHRIVTAPEFRGQKLVRHIVEWARKYAADQGKQYIRLDTIGNNENLIRHYTDCGFDYLGLFEPKDMLCLPSHYHHEKVSLFEIKL